MPTNNRRKNPFTLAPALTFVVLAFFVFIGLFDVKSHVLTGILTLLAFGVAGIFYLFSRGALLLRIPNRALCGRGFGVAFFAAAMMILCSALWKFGVPHASVSLTSAPDSFWQGLGMAVTLAFIPAVCEEYFFRGIVMLEYRFAGVLGASVLSALLFAALHLSLAMFPLYFVNGLILAFVVFLTGDVKMAVTAHLTYNLYALFLERYVYLFALDEESRVLFFAIFGALFLLALYALLRISEMLLRDRSGEEPPVRVPKGKGFWVFYDVISAPSLWLVAVVFLLVTILDLFL